MARGAVLDEECFAELEFSVGDIEVLVVGVFLEGLEVEARLGVAFDVVAEVVVGPEGVGSGHI